MVRYVPLATNLVNTYFPTPSVCAYYGGRRAEEGAKSITHYKEGNVIIGERLKQIRVMKNMSQGDIEHKTGLLRCYISRVENGHTVPSIDTLEKVARAMGVTMAQLFQENGKEPEPLKLPSRPALKLSRKDAAFVARLSVSVSRMKDRDKGILVNLARKMAAR